MNWISWWIAILYCKIIVLSICTAVFLPPRRAIEWWNAINYCILPLKRVLFDNLLYFTSKKEPWAYNAMYLAFSCVTFVIPYDSLLSIIEFSIFSFYTYMILMRKLGISKSIRVYIYFKKWRIKEHVMSKLVSPEYFQSHYCITP